MLTSSHTTHSSQGLGGMFLVKTTKTAIVAVFDSPTSLADCVVEVEKLADYLISMQL